MAVLAVPISVIETGQGRARVRALGDIRVSTVVMGHPDRRHQAEQLQRNHPELDIKIVLDPEPDGKPATLRTAKLAWSTVREGATHQLVLQEDVQLCRGFEEAMVQGLQVAPEGAIAFFANWVMATSQAVRLAAFAGASWTPAVDSWTPTQALVMPAPLARQFATFAEQFSVDKPDNYAVADFLAEHEMTTYVSIPNLVEHRPTESLLLNDLLYGVRNSTVFPQSGDLGASVFTSTVVAPPAVAHLGLGDFESMGHFDPIGSVHGSVTTSHEALITYGMSTLELAEAFASDLDYHTEAVETGFGESLLFQLWQAMFIQGIVASGMMDQVGSQAFDEQLERHPWARAALGTFAEGALRRTCPRWTLRETARQLTPLCITGMRSGFSAVQHWPELRALWEPDKHAIQPRWNAGMNEPPP